MKWISTAGLLMALGFGWAANQAVAQQMGATNPSFDRALGPSGTTGQADSTASGPGCGHATGSQRHPRLLAPTGGTAAGPAAGGPAMRRGRQRHERQGPVSTTARASCSRRPTRTSPCTWAVGSNGTTCGGTSPWHERPVHSATLPRRCLGRHRHPCRRRLLAPRPPRHGRQLLGNLRVPLEFCPRKQFRSTRSGSMNSGSATTRFP